MANWSKLQEDLVGLPVAKRAKHAIHFQKPDGSFVANFSGKPCHYQDGGLWKPIDTGLLATPDGWYSSPHSDVVIHPDGRVRVKNSDYQQFTKLPSAKAGVLSGDRIIRTFPGGEQHLIMKEDGFKEEIHVLKPTFPLEKFIAKTTGNLPSKYRAHPVIAEDADGNTYVFTGDVKAFGAWLDAAKYPVVIDPDFNTTSEAGDTFLNPADTDRCYGTQIDLTRGTFLLRFDCSSVTAGNTIGDASLVMTKSSSVSTDNEEIFDFYSLTAANGNWVEGASANPASAGDPCWLGKESDGSGGVTTAWAGSQGCMTSGTDYEETSLGSITTNRDDAIGTQYTATFNAAGKTRLAGWFGATNTNYGLRTNGGKYVVSFAASENATESYRPVLTVTYTAGGSIIPIVQYYNRLRRN